MTRIPIKAAKEVAQKYDYDQVIIYARRPGNPGPGKEWVTTYGVDQKNCLVAARIGEKLGKLIQGEYILTPAKKEDT